MTVHTLHAPPTDEAPRRAAAGSAAAPRQSPLLVRLTVRYFVHYVRRHFHAARLLAVPPDPPLPPGPAVIYLNHASWWDPIACALLIRRYFPGRRHYAPIDGRALQKYKFLGKLGLFPVDQHSRAGAAAFLRTAAAILEDPDAILWITPQGRFTDPRLRPVTLRPGLAHLARTSPHIHILPLAIEYPFWNERHPELLLHLARPVALPPDPGTLAPAALTRHFAAALEEAQDALAEAARSRDPRRFTTLVSGRGGVHPVYDAVRSVAARLAGRRFSPDHEEPPR